jgi:hypothetical protein
MNSGSGWYCRNRHKLRSASSPGGTKWSLCCQVANGSAFVIGIWSIILSFITKDWTWFSRAGYLITVEAIILFAFFDDLFVHYFLSATGIDISNRSGKEALRNRIETYHKKRAETGGPDYAREEGLYEMSASKMSINFSHLCALIPIWGFGDLPQKFY